VECYAASLSAAARPLGWARLVLSGRWGKGLTCDVPWIRVQRRQAVCGSATGRALMVAQHHLQRPGSNGGGCVAMRAAWTCGRSVRSVMRKWCSRCGGCGVRRGSAQPVAGDVR